MDAGALRLRSQVLLAAEQGFLLKALLLVILLVWPLLYQSGYAMRIMTTGGLFTMLTVAVVIILGQAGQLSFGHSAFYGIGAYTAALLAMKAAVPHASRRSSSGRWSPGSSPSSSAGRCSSCATSTWLSPPSGWARSSWCSCTSCARVTGSTTGLAPVPTLNIFGFDFNTNLRQYYLVWVVAVVIILFVDRALKYRHGPGASGHRHQRDRLLEPGGAHGQLEAPRLRDQRRHLRPGRRSVRLRHHGHHSRLLHLHHRHPPHRHDAARGRVGLGRGRRRHPHDLGDQRVHEHPAVQRGHLLRHHDPAPDLPARRAWPCGRISGPGSRLSSSGRSCRSRPSAWPRRRPRRACATAVGLLAARRRRWRLRRRPPSRRLPAAAARARDSDPPARPSSRSRTSRCTSAV